jgi:hypothetical protein
MANVQRILHEGAVSPRAYPVKASVAQLDVGDFVYWDTGFQGNSGQDTIRPASSGSAGSSAADGRKQFADLFVGVSRQRHDVNSFDKNLLVSVDCEIEAIITNATGVDTAATADMDPGTNVAIAVNSLFVPLDDRVLVSGGPGSITVADNESIGKVSRQIKNGDATVRVHIKGMHVFSQTGV